MLKILVVEDDRFISAIFSYFIKDLGHKLVGRCQSGFETIELCEKERPDIVLMDIHLEGEMDGIQTAERLQRDYEIPVIFISSDTSSPIVERAIITNSYGYLVKPVQKKELGITIDLAYYKHKVALDQKRREQSFRQYISEAPVPMVIIVNKCIQYLNMRALDLFHSHYIEDLIGLPFTNFVGADYVPVFNDVFEHSPRIGRSIEQFDAVFKGLHGKEIDIIVNGSCIIFNNHNALHLILSDISSEKQALYEARVFKEIYKEGSGAVIELNGNFEVTHYNKAFEKECNVSVGLKGVSVFNTDALTIDKELFLNELSTSEGRAFSIEIKVLSDILKCRVYQLNISEGSPERFIISVNEVLQ